MDYNPAPIGLVLLIGFGFNKYSVKFLLGIYSLFNATGISLVPFLLFTNFLYLNYIFYKCLTFGVMALTGYTTKTDLTKIGSLLIMGVVGIVIASIVNMFIGSSLMDYIISIIGVLVFTGLTAYDVQKIKNIGNQIDQGSETAQKMMVLGALTLYLDFINLFLMLLRLFGNKNDNIMKAYISGQGAQFSGMGKDLYDSNESKNLFLKSNEF